MQIFQVTLKLFRQQVWPIDDNSPNQMMHSDNHRSENFPMGSLMPLSPAGTKRSACATVIEGTGLETKKMTTDEQ